MKATNILVVIGVDSMGAAACWYLARNNYKALGLEQFDIPHDQGSHAGQSRTTCLVMMAWSQLLQALAGMVLNSFQ